MDSQQQQTDGAWEQVDKVVDTLGKSSTASLNERLDSIKGLLKNHCVQRACRDAVQARKAEALEDVDRALQADAILVRSLDDLHPGYTAILRAQVQAAFAALGACTGELNEVMRHVCCAVRCLLHDKIAVPDLDVALAVQPSAALKSCDPIDMLRNTCGELHSRLGEQGWAAMAVLHLACDFLDSP